MRFPNRLVRRALLVTSATAIVASLLSAPVHAQAPWPNRPIKLIVPFPPGASNDNIARVLGNKLTARLGQTVVVENKIGAGGNIGTAYVAHQPADGYTLLLASNPLVMANLTGETSKTPPFDAVKDFQPIGLIGAAPFIVAVANDFNAKNLPEFINLARAKPLDINYGSGGYGSTGHLGVELIASLANIKLTHVPYAGLAPAITGLLNGSVQMVLASFPGGSPQVRAGKMRALAVTGRQRSALMPEVATAAEAGLPGFDMEAWWGLAGPAGLPAPVIKRLNEELNFILTTPEMVELLARDGAIGKPGKPEDFSRLIRSELARWPQVIKDARIN